MRPETIKYLALLILLLPSAIGPAMATVSIIYPTRDNVVNSSTWGDFSTVRSASGSQAGGNAERVLFVSLNATHVANQYRLLNRSILIFDTRSIPGTAYIHQVNLSIYHFAKFGGLGNNTGLSITTGVTGNRTYINPGDYERANLSTGPGVVLAPDIPYASFRTGRRFNFTWYSWANRFPYLNVTNYTQVYARLTWDAMNNMNGTWASRANTTIAFASVDNSSTYRPFLEVIWTPFPTANFLGAPVKGTVPLNVQFNHTGSCQNCLYYNWSFGDGTWYNTTNIMDLRNASHFYNTSGSYRVNLSATNIAGTHRYTRSGYIIAQNDPFIAWNANATTANLSTAVYFLDRSTGLNQNRWNWSFNRDTRDRNVSSLRNWSHKFPRTGWYSVNHSVTTNYGLTQALTAWSNQTNYIHIVNNTISGNFNGTPLSGPAPLTVSFMYTGTGGSEENHTWIFHQGSTISPLQNPTYTYLTPGTHSVNHSACNDAGCVWVNKSNYVTVTASQPVASFATDRSTGTQPFTVQFTDTSTNTPTSWLWHFGDGTQDSSQNPVHLYTRAGDFTVNHSATNAGGTGWVNVTHRILSSNPAPVAGFDQAARNWTNTTGPLLFTDTSTGTNVTAWWWEFVNAATGHPDNSTAVKNPIRTFPCNDGDNPADDRCVYHVAQRVTDSAPAIFNVSSPWLNQTGWVTVFRNSSPSVSFNGTPLTGIWPLEVSFTAAPAGGIWVDSWHWDFGEGNTSTLQNPVHVFQDPGTYEVVLTATNFTLGQDVVTKPGYIHVKNKPCTADFTWDVSTGTLPLQVRFTDTSTNDPDTWYWDFGDGNTSMDQNPVKTFETAGQFSVSFLAGNDGGEDWENKTGLITVRNQAPVAGFTADPMAANISTGIQFTDASTGTNITGWSWDFGDGITSSLQNPAHTYPNTGSYTISLNVTDSGETPWNITTMFSRAGFIRVVNNSITPDFSAVPVTGQAPAEVNFTDTSTGGPIENCTYWFGDGSMSTERNPVHAYPFTGTYTVNHSACNDAGCFWVNRSDYITITHPPPPPTPRYYIQIGGQGYSDDKGDEDGGPVDDGSPKDSGDAPQGDAAGTGSTAGSGTTQSNGARGSQGTGDTAGRENGMPNQEQPQPIPASGISALIDTLGDIVTIAGNLLEYLQYQLRFLLGR